MKIRRLARRLGLLFSSVIFLSGAIPTASQSYVWPTNASYFLSSSFAEYRHGHFHAGIDIKTFGQNGFPVYATRSGYIWRIRVSPYGYGRVIYQKLDTGEIVVYAHLQKFMKKLENEVKREQQRRQEFSISKYFKPHEFPVEQGEIIAYTGESGIGPPHLHFEIRDPQNNPINPLTKNFPVIDTVPPVIKRLAVLPIEGGTEINGEFDTSIQRPQFLGKGKYRISRPFRISGAIGLAVDCYDPIDKVSNKLGVSTVKLFLDEQLIYAAEYDTFSYSTTKQIFLDRDFRLIRQGKGVFYRCFRDRSNEINTFYAPFPPESGIIHTRYFEPQLPQDFGGDAFDRSKSTHSQPDSLHSFRIEVADFFNNTTQITGQFIFQAIPELNPRFEIDENRWLNMVCTNEYAIRNCQKLNIFMSKDWGASWYPVYTWNRKSSKIRIDASHRLTRLSTRFQGVKILKIVATDLAGQRFRPFFHVVRQAKNPSRRNAFIALEKQLYDNFINFKIETSTPVVEKPHVTLKPENGQILQLDVKQLERNNFNSFFKLNPQYSGELKIEIQAESVDGKGMFFEEYYNLTAVTPADEKTIKSTDGMCQVKFLPGGVYRPLYSRIVIQEPEKTSRLEIVGLSYRIEPSDVPLKKGATISIKYPPEDPKPEKLGIYVKSNHGKNGWRFAGNILDLENGKIRTEESVFNTYTLIRDETPPEINFIYPRTGMHLANHRPTIKVKIRDRLSGIRGNSQYMRMKLDGNRVIAEYEPETKLLFFQPENALARGPHKLGITAQDRNGNVKQEEILFWIN